MKRVLVLIHFASKLSRENMATVGVRVAPIVRDNLGNFAGVFSSDIAFGCVGTTDKGIDELVKTLIQALSLKSGDNVSVLELGMSIISTHRSLMEWQGQTDFVAYLSESAKQK